MELEVCAPYSPQMYHETGNGAPILRDWYIDSAFDNSPVKKMLEIRLVYQGVLPASDSDKCHSPEKHAIRRYLHKQLLNAWTFKNPLRERAGFVFPATKRMSQRRMIPSGGEFDQDELIQSLGNKRYLPIVSSELCLTCELDILLLSRDLTGVIRRGDLDNRLKTLLDALRMPRIGENSDGDEDPLCCLLEDDKMISRLTVTDDLLLADAEQVVRDPRIDIFGEAVTSTNHVFAVIRASIKPTRIMTGNLDFA